MGAKVENYEPAGTLKFGLAEIGKGRYNIDLIPR